MNKEEILNKYIDLIDKGYCCACNELNCIDNFPHAKIAHAIRELQQENQELKLELSGYRQAILNNKEMLGLKEDNDKLKKQLEDMTLCRDIASGHRKEVQDREVILLNQQKEFVNYLENMLDDENDIFSVVRVKDVLQKYKSIIGVLDEESNNISS